MHHKLSLLYYVLLDFDIVDGQASLSETFASASGMPQKYEIFMKGLWYMDCLAFSVGDVIYSIQAPIANNLIDRSGICRPPIISTRLCG